MAGERVGRLIKLNEAAERLTLSRRSVDRLIASGHLSVVKVSVKRFAIDEDEIERYIKAQTLRLPPLRIARWPGAIDRRMFDAEERLLARLTSKRGSK